MSVVYCTTHGDDILIATMAAHAKAEAVQRLGEASICVLDENERDAYPVRADRFAPGAWLGTH